MRLHFNELVRKNEPFTYYELLNTYEWSNLRERIIVQYSGRCNDCKEYGTVERKGKFYEDRKYSMEASLIGSLKEKSRRVEVHHEYYVKDTLPWNYDFECYVLLCNYCHYNRHREGKILIYEDRSRTKPLNLKPCEKCKGSGHIGKYWYWREGICFRCDGYGYPELRQMYYRIRSGHEFN